MTYLKLRRWMFDILERDTTGDRLADAVYYFLVSVIIVSVLVAVLATMPSLQLHDSVWVNTLERFALIVFVVEYIARLWVAPENPLHSQLPAWKSRLLYMITFAGIIDLIAILPFVLGYFSTSACRPCWSCGCCASSSWRAIRPDSVRFISLSGTSATR